MRAFLLSLSIALFIPLVAHAQDADTQRARSHLRAGIAYYDEAKYDDALREMETAYRLRPLADLQYNIAQCYERLGRAREAAVAYGKYLDGKPAAEDREEVRARVRNLEARAEKETAGTGGPQIVEREKIVLKEVVVYKEAPPRPGRAARGVAIGLGALASARRLRASPSRCSPSETPTR